MATYHPKSSRVNWNHIYASDMNKKSQDKLKKDCLQNKTLRLLIRIWPVNRSKGVKLGFEYDHVAPSGFGIAPIKRVPTTMFCLVRIRPMFEHEAPKWPWEFFNDSDLNIIKVGSQNGLSYDSNTIKKPPSEFGSVPIKRVPAAMFSLVQIRPMFEQEAP